MTKDGPRCSLETGEKPKMEEKKCSIFCSVGEVRQRRPYVVNGVDKKEILYLQQRNLSNTAYASHNRDHRRRFA